MKKKTAYKSNLNKLKLLKKNKMITNNIICLVKFSKDQLKI